jgi:Mn2+/Fe2+ NRAMP family transporter
MALRIPTIRFDKDFLSIIVSILGTTISPYLFFWQATMEAEDSAHSNAAVIVDKRRMDNMKADVNLGMLLSNLVMFFIILTTASILFTAGITHIDTVDQAAKAYRHIGYGFIGDPGTGRFTVVYAR